MKKIFAIIAVMALMLTFFAACGKKKGDINFSGGNSSTVVAPSGSSDTSSEASSEIKDIEDIWGNVSIGVDLDSITPKPSSSKPDTSDPSTSNPSTSNPSTSNPSTSNPSTSNPSTSNPSTSNPSQTSSQSTSSRGTTSKADDSSGFKGWYK